MKILKCWFIFAHLISLVQGVINITPSRAEMESFLAKISAGLGKDFSENTMSHCDVNIQEDCIWKCYTSRRNVSTIQSDHDVLHGEIWASDAKCQTATLVHQFYNRSSRFNVLIIVTERKYNFILGRPTSPVGDSWVVLRQRILPGYCFFKTWEICILTRWFSVNFCPILFR